MMCSIFHILAVPWADLPLRDFAGGSIVARLSMLAVGLYFTSAHEINT